MTTITVGQLPDQDYDNIQSAIDYYATNGLSLGENIIKVYGDHTLGSLDVSGISSDSTSYIVLQGFGTNVLTMTGSLNVSLSANRYNKIEDLTIQADSSFPTGGYLLVANYQTSLSNVVVRNTNNVNTSGINTGTNTDALFENVLVYGFNGTANRYGINGSNTTLKKCTVYNCGRGINSNTSIVEVSNCVSFNNSSYDFNTEGETGAALSLRAAMQYCASSDDSTLNTVSPLSSLIATDEYVDPDNGDFTLKQTSNLIGVSSTQGNIGYEAQASAGATITSYPLSITRGDNSLLTITTDGSFGTTPGTVTYGTRDVTNVTWAEGQITFNVPSNINLKHDPVGYTLEVITDDNLSSVTEDIPFNVETGYRYFDVDVDSVDVTNNSVFYNEVPADLSGTQYVHTTSTSPDNIGVIVSKEGFITLDSLPSQTQTFTGYIISSSGIVGTEYTFTLQFGGPTGLSISSLPAEIRYTESASITVATPAEAPTLLNTEIRLNDAAGELAVISDITGNTITFSFSDIASYSIPQEKYGTKTLYVSVAAENLTTNTIDVLPPTGKSYVDITNVDQNDLGQSVVIGDQLEYVNTAGANTVTISSSLVVTTSGEPTGESVSIRIYNTDSWGNSFSYTPTALPEPSDLTWHYVETSPGIYTYPLFLTNEEATTLGSNVDTMLAGSSFTEVASPTIETVVHNGTTWHIASNVKVENSNTAPAQSLDFSTIQHILIDIRPVITVSNQNPTININTVFDINSGVSATDGDDGDITSDIISYGLLDNSTVGSYTILYQVVDSNGNYSEPVFNTITVVDPNLNQNVDLPTLTLFGSESITVGAGQDTYAEPGFSAVDNNGNNITNLVNVTNSDIDTTVPGSHVIEYEAVDSNGLKSEKKFRLIEVVASPPTLSLLGPQPYVVNQYNGQPGWQTIEDTILGYAASDYQGNDIRNLVTYSNIPSLDTPGTYTIEYSVTDPITGIDSITKARSVTVVEVIDTTPPVITLNGANFQTFVTSNSTYTDPGFSAADNNGVNLTPSVEVSGDTVDLSSAGVYTKLYTVSDSNNISSVPVKRTIVVSDPVDTDIPQIVLTGSNYTITEDPNGTYDPYSNPKDYYAVDSTDGVLTDQVTITGTVDITTPGIYVLKYDVVDLYGNSAPSQYRYVEIVRNFISDSVNVPINIPFSGEFVDSNGDPLSITLYKGTWTSDDDSSNIDIKEVVIVNGAGTITNAIIVGDYLSKPGTLVIEDENNQRAIVGYNITLG